VDIMPLPLPPVQVPAPKQVVAAKIAEPVVTAVATPAATPVAAPVAARVATPVAAPVAIASAPLTPPAKSDSAIPPHVDVPADKLIRTPLGPFTVPGALLGDRDKEARYCYAQLGLKYNPDLKGEITVKLSLASDGTVQDAAVTKRSWQGISAGEVESCVRALARDWTFSPTDATIVDGAKLLTFSFAP
jgi:outer membrane biosynthesis protein TonB